jgi:hypothetical protein
MNGRDQPLFPKSGKDPERKRNGEQLTRRDGQHRLAVLDSGRETPFRIIPELLVHAPADFLRQEGTAPPRPSAPVGQVDESPEHAVPQQGEVDRKVRPGRSARGSGVEKVARGPDVRAGGLQQSIAAHPNLPNAGREGGRRCRPGSAEKTGG